MRRKSFYILDSEDFDLLNKNLGDFFHIISKEDMDDKDKSKLRAIFWQMRKVLNEDPSPYDD